MSNSFTTVRLKTDTFTTIKSVNQQVNISLVTISDTDVIERVFKILSCNSDKFNRNKAQLCCVHFTNSATRNMYQSANFYTWHQVVFQHQIHPGPANILESGYKPLAVLAILVSGPLGGGFLYVNIWWTSTRSLMWPPHDKTYITWTLGSENK